VVWSANIAPKIQIIRIAEKNRLLLPGCSHCWELYGEWKPVAAGDPGVEVVYFKGEGPQKGQQVPQWKEIGGHIKFGALECNIVFCPAENEAKQQGLLKGDKPTYGPLKSYKSLQEWWNGPGKSGWGRAKKKLGGEGAA
jgi:hypothetical protein